LSLYDQRFVLFSGKGGVGKTVISSAYALSCARRGERTLLIELNVQDKVSSFFGSSNVGNEIIEVEDNLHAVNVTPDAALKEYGLMILKVKLIYKAVFENRIVRSFLRSIPGLNDLLMLGKAYFHATEMSPEGSYVWDKVVVDAPATGHGLFFLQIPSVITGFVSSGHMYEEAKRIQELLQDPEQTAINLVTLAEDMPVNETLMMRDELKGRMGLQVASVIANGIYPPLFSDEQFDWIEDAQRPSEPSSTSTRGFLEGAAFRSQRVDLQKQYLERLERDVEQPIYYVPYHFTERVTFPVISEIADELEAQVTGTQSSDKSSTTDDLTTASK
jgi:anion-transporting  ArsA/GET3 family ATPase